MHTIISVVFSHQRHRRKGRKALLHFFSLATALLLTFVTIPLLAQQDYILGDGEDINGESEYPAIYGNAYEGARHQVLVHASELTELGASSGYITSLGFNVDESNDCDPLADFTVRMKLTNTVGVSNVFEAGDWTTVYSNSSQDIFSNWNTYQLSSGFFWDGTSNILVDVCFHNTGTSNNASMLYTETDFNSVVYYRANSSDVCNSSNVTDVSRRRPDMQFTLEQSMVYEFSDGQQVTFPVDRGVEDAELVRINIRVDGSYNPITISNFLFSTQGSTSSSDIDHARVYYTGKSDEFDIENQFGETVDNPTGAFTVSGLYELQPGNNYFWLAYDIADDAGLGNQVDAVLQSFVIDDVVHSLTNSNMDGARTIWPYCMSEAESDDDSFISEVSIAGIVNQSPSSEKDNGAIYTNYTNLPAVTIIRERDFPIAITKDSKGENKDAWANVFIDWNRDGEFDTKGELAFSGLIPGDETTTVPQTIDGTITVPASADLGLTGMRVVLWEGKDNEAEPCDSYDAGETEDYIVTIMRPATLVATEKLTFGTVGSERRFTLEVTNISPIEKATIERWNIAGKGASSYRVYLPGTTTEIPKTVTLSPNEVFRAEVVFGNSSFSHAGIQTATLEIEHNGVNKSPINISLSGEFASIEAFDGARDLLASGEKLDVGVAEVAENDGPTVSTQIFRVQSDGTAMKSPILITGYTLTGPNADVFKVSTLPAGVLNREAIISVALYGAGVTPGVKEATLTIFHSGANTPSITIQLLGRVGKPTLQVPSLVNVEPVALGSTYTHAYDNITLIPLTQKGNAPVEIYANPVLTGSGANAMEIISNSGRFYIKGQYNASGDVIPANDLDFRSTWASPSNGSPIVADDAQPWLIAVRMRTPSSVAITGMYSADIVFADGRGHGISNAMNEAAISLIGEIVNDVTSLAFSPLQLSYGMVPIGSVASKTLTLRNQNSIAGNVTLDITGSNYSFANGTKLMEVALSASNEPVSLQVYFTPSAAGAANGSIRLDGVIKGLITLSGTGQAANPGNLLILIDGQLVNGTVDFGNVGIGRLASKTITIVNNNAAPVTLSSIGRSGRNATQFTIGTAPETTIQGNGGSVSFAVNFVPTSLSTPDKSAIITVFNNTGVPKSFDVRGTAVTGDGDIVSVQLTPLAYNFGNQTGTHEFTLTNNSSTAITVNGALVLGSVNFTVLDDASSFPRTVAAGRTTTITVRFDASQGTNGLRSASLLVITPGITPYPTASLTGRVGSGSFGGNGGVQALAGGENNPSIIELSGNYPNPFSDKTTVQFRLLRETSLLIHVYNEAGDEVHALNLGILRAGEQSVQLQVQNLVSGTYYYVIDAGAQRVTGTMLLVH